MKAPIKKVKKMVGKNTPILMMEGTPANMSMKISKGKGFKKYIK